MPDNKVLKTARKPPAAGMGRKKGVPNKMTKEVKQMILDALEGVGGVDYLIAQAHDKPAAFLALVGKVLPLQVANVEGEAFQIEQIVRTVVDPAHGKT